MNFGCAATIEFWYWAAANSCCHFKTKLAHTSWFPLQPRWYVPVFAIFAHSEPFLTQFLKNRGGMLYFPLWLYNCVCIFSTFYRSCIHRGCTTAFVSLIQPRLNVFFLLVISGKLWRCILKK